MSHEELVQRLREHAWAAFCGRDVIAAADLIEQQARDIAALRSDIEHQIAIAKEASERAEGLVKTIERMGKNTGVMRAQIEQYQALCAAAYQLAGAMNAPVRFLDALSDGANGELEARAKTDDLLPVTSGEVGTFADALMLTMDDLALIRTAAHVVSSLGNEHMAWGLRTIYTKLGGK